MHPPLDGVASAVYVCGLAADPVGLFGAEEGDGVVGFVDWLCVARDLSEVEWG